MLLTCISKDNVHSHLLKTVRSAQRLPEVCRCTCLCLLSIWQLMTLLSLEVLEQESRMQECNERRKSVLSFFLLLRFAYSRATNSVLTVELAITAVPFTKLLQKAPRHSESASQRASMGMLRTASTTLLDWILLTVQPLRQLTFNKSAQIEEQVISYSVAGFDSVRGNVLVHRSSALTYELQPRVQ